jgi:hypothetical protein
VDEMTRRRFVIRNGKEVELDLDAPLPRRVAPYIQSDIAPYPSVITREMITSRSEHREHLRRHGAVEVGNEYPKGIEREVLPPVRDDLRAALEASPETHAEARAASGSAKDAGPVGRILP